MQSAQYDAQYYHNCCGPLPYSRDYPQWYAMFSQHADIIHRTLGPETVYDAGCASGIFVEALRDRGINASGGDISPYAISQVPDRLRAYCRLWSLATPIDHTYDLITCIEVLEHLTEPEVEGAIQNLCGATDTILFSASPDDYSEPTHLTVKPVPYWLNLFSKYGFYPDISFDASFINNHAFLVRRRSEMPTSDFFNVFDLLRRERAEFRSQLERTQTDLERLNIAYSNVIYSYNSILRSTIWRATSPVRRVLDALPELTRRRLRSILKRAYPHKLIHSGSSRFRMQLGNRPIVPRSRVLIISGDINSPGHTYRVLNTARGLNAHGITCDIASYDDLEEVLDSLEYYRAIIIWRLATGPAFPHSQHISDIRKQCTAASIPMIFDIDDLVFAPQLCTPDLIDGLRSMNESERQQYITGIHGYQRTLELCDLVNCSTTTLHTYITQTYHKPCIITRNALDERYESALHLPPKQHLDSKVTIGYTPGSRTHQKDFREVYPALTMILETHPKAHLHILGELDLTDYPELLNRYTNQVSHDKRLGRELVYSFQSQIDINIVPLEQHNIFTASKSELKYFEAAAFGVPTIASPVGPFVECIISGVNGYLAHNTEDWYRYLDDLITSPYTRAAVGSSARQHVKDSYNVANTTKDLMTPLARQQELANGQQHA